jgi:hypothetical protein
MAFAANGTGTGGPKQGLAVNGAWFPDGLDPKLERSFNDAHKAVRKDGGFSMSCFDWSGYSSYYWVGALPSSVCRITVRVNSRRIWRAAQGAGWSRGL